MPSHSSSTNEARASLQRRFTTDLSKMPALPPIGQLPNQGIESAEYSSGLHKVQLWEKKRAEYDILREQRRRFEAELEKFNIQQAREKQQLDQMTQDLIGMDVSAGHQSEPTTPPEYRDQVYPSVFSRTNRYSSSSLTSPPGLNNRSSRSGSVLTSPPSEIAQTLHNHISSDTLPSKSVPGSRRGSNDRIASYNQDIMGNSQRAPANAKNRYSMPVTGSRTRKDDAATDYASMMGLGHINTTGFLFDNDDEKAAAKKEATTSPDVKTYLQMNDTDDKFPILVRRDGYPGLLSASSAALDLALSQSPGPEAQLHDATSFARHRSSQPNLPQELSNGAQNTPSNNGITSSTQQPEMAGNTRQLNRHSMEASLAAYAQSTLPGQIASSDSSSGRPSLANIQSSYSTNDIPTVKNSNGAVPTVTPPKTHAEQHFHNHNASLGRIPPNALGNRHSRELSGADNRRDDSMLALQGNGYQQNISSPQASAASYSSPNPPVSLTDTMANQIAQVNSPQYASPSFYGGYGMQLMSMGMTPLQMTNPAAFNQQLQTYQQQNSFAPFQNYGQPGRFQDSQARVIQQRRMQNNEENARFNNVRLEHVRGEIYGLCKDQHGCRYLQKQLESGNPEHVHLIFMETNAHVVELMTDPFGNYLCQKLLEYSNDDQRTILINNAAPSMVKIALNQHGTRALQKMIEFISTRKQIQTIIFALHDRVVELIQDLNGNHVIQKCLNRLTPDDAQFIFDAVGANCVVVGTHRHGCCVLQRCIDHASGHQKAQLISQITANAFSLVQDPFGNYVLQYIVDLGESAFTDPLCYSFQGSIPLLSKQKFSSNVIEKCLRGAQPTVSRMMIEEMLNGNELEKMLRDSFANYVIQTALDYADPDTRAKLVDTIRPILPSIRQTPYGRRLQSKITASDGPGRRSGMGTPIDPTNPGQISMARQSSGGANGYSSYNGGNKGYVAQANGGYPANMATFAVPNQVNYAQPHFGNGSPNFGQYTSEHQGTIQQPLSAYGRQAMNGFNYF